jgi:hypothetical protein
MGRNTAAKNGLAPPIWVRLPFEQDEVLRKLARNRKVGTVARELILEALALRSRNRASEG